MTVAQLVEPWIVASVVAGSSPVSHPYKTPDIQGFCFALPKQIIIKNCILKDIDELIIINNPEINRGMGDVESLNQKVSFFRI